MIKAIFQHKTDNSPFHKLLQSGIYINLVNQNLIKLFTLYFFLPSLRQVFQNFAALEEIVHYTQKYSLLK